MKDPKPWYKSRNFWLAAALAACGVIVEATGGTFPAWLVSTAGVIQMWLRAHTSGAPLRFGPPPVDSEG